MTVGNSEKQAATAQSGLLSRIKAFFSTESAPGVLLFIAAVLAMVVAGSLWFVAMLRTSEMPEHH